MAERPGAAVRVESLRRDRESGSSLACRYREALLPGLVFTGERSTVSISLPSRAVGQVSRRKIVLFLAAFAWPAPPPTGHATRMATQMARFQVLVQKGLTSTGARRPARLKITMARWQFDKRRWRGKIAKMPKGICLGNLGTL